MAQRIASRPSAEESPKSHFRSNNTVTISTHGDLALQIEEGCSSKIVCYRVSSSVLRSISSYFDVLLDPAKFSEGIQTATTAVQLEKDYPDISLVPTSSLPKITVFDVGQFPIGMSNRSILTHFFRILHNAHYSSLNIATPLVVALLAIVADRFDAVVPIAAFVRANKKAMKTIMKTRDEIVHGRVAEDVIRQNILVGLLLHIDDLVLHWSARLIMEGSSKWHEPDEVQHSEVELQWWNLPEAIEEELSFRRTCILATISSLQDHFLRVYASKARQCKLGYDSSAQCDSFQLGEMVKFFVKRGTLDLQSRLFESRDCHIYVGTINALLSSLGECPEYQIDGFHKHCGLRSRFRPAIEFLKFHCGYQGLCMSCWRADRRQYSWSDTSPTKEWVFVPEMKVGAVTARTAILPSSACSNFHAPHRVLFTSQRRDWTPGTSA